MTLGEIILKLRYRLNDMTTDVEGEYRDEELIKYINEALAWFCRVLREYKITTPNFDNQNCLVINGTDDRMVSDGIEIPENIFDVERVIVKYGPTDGTKITDILIRKTKYDLEDLYPPEGLKDNPKYYCVENKWLYIYPTKGPTDTESTGLRTYKLNIRGFAIQELEKETDTINWFRENYQSPFLDACEYMARRTRPTVDGNFQICQTLNNSVLAFFNERGRVEPRQAGVK